MLESLVKWAIENRLVVALLFAFSLMYFRGLSANLLSLGAVDFGIIVDSSVIMVERIYSRMSSASNAEQPVDQNIPKIASQFTNGKK